MTDNRVILMGCGDIGPIHEPMAQYSTLARPVLAAADIRFAQCERIYSDKGTLQTQGHPHPRIAPHMASVFSDCGFDVVSVASNHTMDFGGEALLDSMANFHRRGIQTIGGGRDEAEARRPAIIERNGVKIAFLGYCSVLQAGYQAGPKRAGIAPMRAHTYYRPWEYQPGVPPRVVTMPYEEDVAAMENDIAAARSTAHVVVVSMHWGIHFIPRMIADYQTIVAKAAFAAGADLILGHHSHLPKAVASYGGKICFYDLGTFIMSNDPEVPGRPVVAAERLGIALDPDYPRLPYGPGSHRGLIAKAVLSRAGVEKVSFLPTLIDRQLRPEAIRHGDPRFDEAVRYIDWTSQGFPHDFTIEGDEVNVAAT